MIQHAERVLWLAVLAQAIDDLKYNLGRMNGIHVRNNARHWFRSNATFFNTFRGICSMLRIDAEAIFKMNKQFILIDEIVKDNKIIIKDHDIKALILDHSIPHSLQPKEKRKRRTSSTSLEIEQILSQSSSLSRAARLLRISLPTLLWRINMDEHLMKIRMNRFRTFKKGVSNGKK